MATEGFVVRRYRPGDEHAIQQMYETVWERKRSLEEWRWRFLDSPAGPAMMYLLEAEDGVVGHLAQAPMPTSVDGQSLLLGQGGDTMVLPSCRGRGGMRMLVEASLSDHPYDLLLRFPSEIARPLFVRYGAGSVVGKLPLWVRRQRLTRPLPALARPLARMLLAMGRVVADRPRPGTTVESLAELGTEVDELAGSSRSWARCLRIRDAAYLRWRWLEQPDARSEFRAARRVEGALCGISVLGLADSVRGRVGWINDLLAADYATLRALLVDAVGTLAGQGANSICAYYLDPRPWARRAFIRSGFLPSREGDRFLALSVSAAAGTAPERLNSWYLTRSDTEPWPSLTAAELDLDGI